MKGKYIQKRYTHRHKQGIYTRRRYIYEKDIYKEEHTNTEQIYIKKDIHTEVHTRKEDIHIEGIYTKKDNIHGWTHTQRIYTYKRNVHTKAPIHKKDIYTKEHRHKRIYIRRDIYAEKTFTQKGHTHGETYK